MPQARILGNLVYREPDHSWALDVGGSLARREFLTSDFTEADIPGIDNARREAVVRAPALM
jgi:hypothetical protein